MKATSPNLDFVVCSQTGNQNEAGQAENKSGLHVEKDCINGTNIIRFNYGLWRISDEEEEIVMRIKTTILFSLIASLSIATLGFAAEGVTEPDGRSLAFDNKKGNCLACHAIPGEPKAESPGNIGPTLVKMKERYPDRAKLRAKIWDATSVYPDSVMPPFGRNKILTEQEIDLVTDYIQGL